MFLARCDRLFLLLNPTHEDTFMSNLVEIVGETAEIFPLRYNTRRKANRQF